MYGTFDPQAPYGNFAQQVVAANIPRGLLGLLVDQKFGLLVYSPLYLLALAGAWLMLRRSHQRAQAVAIIVTAGLFVLATTRFYMWWGGTSAPARFLVPILPLAAPLIAVAIDRLDDRLGRAAVVTLTIATLAIAAIAAASHREQLLYSNPHGVSPLIGALQGPAPLDLLLPTFTEESLRAPLTALLPWLMAVIIALAVVALLMRARIVRESFWIAVSFVLLFATVGGIAASRPNAATRAAAEAQGRLTLLHAYDPDRFHAIDASGPGRLGDDAVRESMHLEYRPSDDPTSRLPQLLTLPEGTFQARLWFDGDAARPGDFEVVTSDQTVLARTIGPLSNPWTSTFRMPVTAAVRPRMTDPASQRAIRQVEITPIALVPHSGRVLDDAVAVETIGQGSVAGVLAYADHDSYPEGGVFWTRGTAQSTVAVIKDPAAHLRLVLHVGPAGARVDLEIARKRLSFDLQPNETREVPVDLPAGATHAIVSVRADRAFVPASIDRKNEDRRLLGCQVRPVLF